MMSPSDLGNVQSEGSPEALYLDLLKKCLTRYIFPEQYESYELTESGLKSYLYAPIRSLLTSHSLELVRSEPVNRERRAEGRDWPRDAETMIGLKRLDNLQYCITEVLQRKVPGDFIETGVWRGGASIFMRAVLKVYGDTTRVVWVADSFQGLPKPDPQRYPADAGNRLWSSPQLAIPLEAVKANFARYGMLDEQVRFLVGWFRDTLSTLPSGRLSIIRLDGDMYESTMDALTNLYPKLSVGGFAIVDDYGAVPACMTAVDDFRSRQGITEKMEAIDWTGIFWQRVDG